MNLKQARYIQTIAQEGSITAAARKLYISQPSLSQMLKQVEVELGAALFDRSVSPVHLTLAGEACLQAAEAILAANDRLERQLQEIRDESRGRLRLGISVQRGMQVLPLALPWFLARFPHVALEITERGSADLEELVLKGGVDVALAVIDSTSPRLRYELIEEEVTGILAGAGSRLAARFPSGTLVPLDAAAEDTFVSLKEGHSARVVQDALVRRYGLQPKILLESDSFEVARRVALGTGSCMLCSNLYMDDLAQRHGAFYPLKNYENHRHFYACYPKDGELPRYAAEFIRITAQVLSQKALSAQL